MKCFAVFAFLFLFNFVVNAQDDGTYKQPPADIRNMLLVNPTPAVSINDKGDWMLQMQGTNYPAVEELAKPEYRIAGLRINPANFSPSRQNYIVSFSLTQIATGKSFSVTGLPKPLYAGNVRWTQDGNKIAFTNTAPDRVDLYVIDVNTKKASKVNTTPLNLVTGNYSWIDNNSLLYRTIIQPVAAAPVRPLTPKGPAVQENYGKASPRPTYQDMIKSPFDESLFKFFATSQLVKNTNAVETKIGLPAIYNDVAMSPDKKYMLVEKVITPFSYLVPASGFPSVVSITDNLGRQIKVLATLPGSETAPSGNDNVQNLPRGFEWRDDAAATVIWAQPLDSGLIKNNVEYRDAVYSLSAPFSSEPKELLKTSMRFGGITWGNENLALVTEYLRSKQLVQVNAYDPSTGKIEMLLKRNTTDAYTSSGTPVTIANQFGKNVIQFVGKDKQNILYNNTTGSSPRGDLPFLLSYNLISKTADTLWRSKPGVYETVVKVLDPEKLSIITRRESKTEVPAYWLKNLRLKIADQKLTSFSNPYPQMEGVVKEKIKYQRADGVTLTGDLYLPKGFRPGTDKPLPVLIWAYPAEYNSAADAGQVRGSEDRFTFVNGGSPIFYVTQGYAVLNAAEMPIVATSADKKPNDNFIEQLTMNAEAAINKLSELGVGDKNRMAVGGHSYGAFMTANLLAHTTLFKAGIARSGAYNRSLTPFGFQNEDRTYWQAMNLYTEMSPFSYADKIKTPLLLIHGEMDNNTGTYPIQSERLFNAIKGQGGTVRFVSLPFEAHGYAGRENVLHVLAEQLEWLNKYVKNAK